ncbi:Beta-1,3-galactosyltransferase 1 [Holothuria leucospilota]|uniref:Hexosyltransferase n=1 Tax=Holothuria leucospilota TaxID=206669 RepID=A0A9Q1C6V3_HOLLE|nr:Beta-1,3-galactosyltransferase 1 [Holothuria leucospilota]
MDFGQRVNRFHFVPFILCLVVCTFALWWTVIQETSVVPPREPSYIFFKVQDTNIHTHLTSVPDNIEAMNRQIPFKIRDLCNVTRKNTKEVFLLVLMLSAPMNFEQRQNQRLHCLNVSEVSGKRIERLFLLGNSADKLLNEKIMEEFQIFQDILISDFQDSYRNLTLKTLSGLEWASLHCSNARYVMKVDDDTLINFKTLIDTLTISPKEDFITGRVCRRCRPMRGQKQKWYVSLDEYPKSFYPDYVRGPAYVMSGDFPAKIINMSLKTPFFLWEDVYIGMILEKLAIRPRNNQCFVMSHPLEQSTLCKYITACAIHFNNRPQQVFRYCKSLNHFHGNATDNC